MNLLREDGSGVSLREESLEKGGTAEFPVQVRTVTENGQTVSVTRTEYQKFSFGTAVIRETGDPDGAALITESEWFTDENSPACGKLKKQVFPDGSSVSYTYGTDGRETGTSRHFGDTPDGSVTEYDCTPHTRRQ